MGWQSFGKLVRSTASAIPDVAKGADNVIGRSIASLEPPRASRLGQSGGYQIMGDYRVQSPESIYADQISASNRAKTSSTSMSNQVFAGNRHPGLSTGVEDFTGLDVSPEAIQWMTTGKAEWLRDTFLKAKGSTKANPKYITFQDLVAQHDALPKGPKKTSLKKRIEGYQSGMATPWAKNAEDIIRYQKGNEPAITAQLKETNPELFSPQLHQSTEFHHFSMKAIDGPFFEHAEKLVRENKATVIDMINLHNLNKHYGIESGSRIGAALPMQRGPHNWMHKSRTKGLRFEPDSTKEAARTLRKSIAKMKDPPEILEGISDADWSKVKASGATTLDDIEYIKNWADTVGYTKAIKKWKAAKAKGKIYVSDGKSEIQRMIEEFESIDNIAELTEWRKSYLEDVVLPMKDEAVRTEAFAKEMSPEDLARSNQWAQKGMGPELEDLMYDKDVRTRNEALESWPPQGVPIDPNYRPIPGDFQ